MFLKIINCDSVKLMSNQTFLSGVLFLIFLYECPTSRCFRHWEFFLLAFIKIYNRNMVIFYNLPNNMLYMYILDVIILQNKRFKCHAKNVHTLYLIKT